MDTLAKKLAEKDYLPIFTERFSATTWPERREELRLLLEKYCYGKMPAFRGKVSAEVKHEDPAAFAGKATQRNIELSIETPQGLYRLPLFLVIPNAVKKPPVFLLSTFFNTLIDKFTPVEEVIDCGFALVSVFYEDISPDPHNGDFSSGLCGHLVTTDANGKRAPETTGRIGVWAWCLSRILDWLLTLDELNAAHTAVIGHSRLGKTALWAAANDERFWCAIANDAGFGGDACAKNGHGERVIDFINAGSWDWFCENFKNDVGKEDFRLYDQHFLLALIAPRLLCIGSAAQDRGADPEAQFLSALSASTVWENLGTSGLVTPDRMPTPGESFSDGNIHFHLREGTHFLSRTDWNCYMDFLRNRNPSFCNTCLLYLKTSGSGNRKILCKPGAVAQP